MTERKQPNDPPKQGAPDPAHAPNGIPAQAREEEPAGAPTADRHKTETAAGEG